MSGGGGPVKREWELPCATCDPVCQIVCIVGDITRQDGVDAVVNAANSLLKHGSGVARALRKAAGPDFVEECFDSVAEHGPIAVGDARVTSAHRLPNDMVVHAVGPRWLEHSDDGSEELKLLHSAVFSSLRLAAARGASSIAIPAISSGKFGLPKEECARVLFDAALAFLDETRHGAEPGEHSAHAVDSKRVLAAKITGFARSVFRGGRDHGSGAAEDGKVASKIFRILFVNFDDETSAVFEQECDSRRAQREEGSS